MIRDSGLLFWATLYIKLIYKALLGSNFRGAVFPEIAETISGTHCTYPHRDGQAEWVWINTRMVDPPKVVTNPSANQDRCSLISLMRRTLLPLRQTCHTAVCKRVYVYDVTQL